MNSPRDQEMIVERLRRVEIYGPTAAALAETLNPAQVREISDQDLADLVDGILPALPLHPEGGLPLGLPGALEPSRWVGSTGGGPPVSGEFDTGDWVTAPDGVWFCTAGDGQTVGSWENTSTLAAAPDATTTSKGIVKLAGDLAGTALLPRVPALAAKADLVAGKVPASQLPAPFTPTGIKTTNYAAAVGDLVLYDISAASRVLTLPAAPADGSRISAKIIATAGTNTLTVNCGGSDVFNKTGGPTSATLSLLNQLIGLQYSAGSGIWYVVGDDLPLSQLDARFSATYAPKLSAALNVSTRMDSHSYGNVQSPVNCSPGGLYIQRLKTRLTPSTFAQFSNNGYYALDVAAVAIGTAHPASNVGAPNGGLGLEIIDCVQNDMMVSGTDAQGLTGFQHSLRALLWLFQAATRVEETDSSFTYGTGTWSPTSGAQYSGGAFTFSSSAGAQASIVTTATDAVLLTVGVDNNFAAIAGGASTVALGGVQQATITHGNACRKSTTTSQLSCPIAVPLIGMGAGSKTITLTKTDGAGTNVYADALLTLTRTPPTVLVMKQLYLDQYQLSGSDAAVTAYNAAIDTVISSVTTLWPSAEIIAVDANPYLTGTKSQYFKNRHPNDLGMERIAQAIYDTLAGLSFRQGRNVLS